MPNSSLSALHLTLLTMMSFWTDWRGGLASLVQADTGRLIYAFITSRTSTAKHSECCNTGTDQDQTESTQYTGFNVSALAACVLEYILRFFYWFLNQSTIVHMSEMLLSYVPNMSLRSSGTDLLTIPKLRTKSHGETFFSYYVSVGVSVCQCRCLFLSV